MLVPEEVDQSPDRLMPLNLARGVMLHGGVGQETVEVARLVADIERPGVAGDQVVDVQTILDGDPWLHWDSPFLFDLIAPA